MRQTTFLGLVLVMTSGCGSARSSSDAGVVGNDVGSSREDAATTASHSGYVDVDQTLPRLNLAAYFGPVSISNLRRGVMAPDCVVVRDMAPCLAVWCPTAGPDSDDAGELSVETGGAPLISAAAATFPNVTPSGGDYNAYYSEANGVVDFSGQMVTVRAAGGTVPAFRASVVGPAMFTGTLPATISRTHDLVLTWPPLAADQVWFQSGGDPTTATAPFIFCTVPAADGTLTVPAAMFEPYEDAQHIDVSVSTASVTTVTAGDYAIDFSVSRSVDRSSTVSP